MKHHPYFQKLLSGDSSRIAYGARTLNEGGLQSVPKLNFPGGALIGCSAGFVNIAKIKGTHNAMKSGMLAAEAAFDVVAKEGGSESAADLSTYDSALRSSWVYSDLHEVRNLRASFNTPLGIWGGIAYSGIDSLILKGRTPWTFRNKRKLTDAQHTGKARDFKPIEYPPFQPPLSTDLLTSLALTGTNHAEDQPIHLRVVGEDKAAAKRKHVEKNVGEYAGLLGRACPAAVYEYVEDEEGNSKESWGGKKLVINSQVGLHFVERKCFELNGIVYRTAFTASSAISRCLRRTSIGLYRKEAADRSIVSLVKFSSVVSC
jgi:electron-transferring-flavoprotein dehydrogenase